MPTAPVIDPESSVLSYPQWRKWEHIFSASQSPTSWNYTSGGIPTGMQFQPTTAATGTNSSKLIHAAGHPFKAGNMLMFASKTGGSSVNLATPYFVINLSGDDFQLAATVNGSAVSFGSDISAATLFRPGQLIGAGTVASVSKLRLTATNATGTSEEAVFVIGIEPAAPSLTSTVDWIWDVDTGDISQLTTSTTTTPVAADAPLMTVKEGDDRMVRVRLRKGGTFIDLAMTDFRWVLKEFEPEDEVAVSDVSVKEGSDTEASYLVHAKFEGAVLAASLTNYEGDIQTGYKAIAELEITYANPESIGPETLVLTSNTFRVLLLRDVANNA